MSGCVVAWGCVSTVSGRILCRGCVTRPASQTRVLREPVTQGGPSGEFPATKYFLFGQPADKSREAHLRRFFSFLCLKTFLDSGNFGHDAMRTPIFPGARPGVSCGVLERL